jgi:hypothetical protein
MNRFQPVTVPVTVVRMQEDYTTPGLTAVEPNPVVAELPPAGPPPKPVRAKPNKPRPPKAAAAAPAAASPFPAPPPAR